MQSFWNSDSITMQLDVRLELQIISTVGHIQIET